MGTFTVCSVEENKKAKPITKTPDLPYENTYSNITPEKSNINNKNYIGGIKNENTINPNFNERNMYTPNNSSTILENSSSHRNNNMNFQNAQSYNINNINMKNVQPYNNNNIIMQNEKRYYNSSNINIQNEKRYYNSNNINIQNEKPYDNNNINIQNNNNDFNNSNLIIQNTQPFNYNIINAQNEKFNNKNNINMQNSPPFNSDHINIQNNNDFNDSNLNSQNIQPFNSDYINMQNKKDFNNSNLNSQNTQPFNNNKINTQNEKFYNNKNTSMQNEEPYNNNKTNMENAPPSIAFFNSNENIQSSSNNIDKKPDKKEEYFIKQELKNEPKRKEIKKSQNLDQYLEEIRHENKDKNENNTMYDAIYSCESIKELYSKGWDYVLNKEFIRRMQKDKKVKEVNEEMKFCPLCIIGETNKGKTYILNLLTNNRLESGIEYKTEGISCKFTNFNEEDDPDTEKKFLLFDTAGRSEPLLIDPKKKKEFTDEDLKRTVESNNRDLKNSEEFMKNILIKYSKIIVVVVNNLSLAEQLFLFELKNEGNYEELFIIHNIFHFKTKEEMEEYIENTIINSIYFDLSKDYYDIEEESQNSVDKPYYFTEEIKKNGAEKAIITHLILGEWESEDKWIRNFNEKTIDFMKTKMQVCVAKDFFDIGVILEKELKSESIIGEKTNIIKEEPKDLSEKEQIKGKLKIEKIEGKPEMKECDNIFDNYIIRGYTPHYIHYKEEEKGEMSFIIEVECAGMEDPNISITAKQRKTKTFFNIEGKKIYPQELKKIDSSKYADKPFTINFYVNNEKEREGKEFFIIDTSEEINRKKPTYENGIYKKLFPMKKVTKTVKRLKFTK